MLLPAPESGFYDDDESLAEHTYEAPSMDEEDVKKPESQHNDQVSDSLGRFAFQILSS